jgi:hypothetical protein
MSRQEILDTRLAHSRLSGEYSFIAFIWGMLVLSRLESAFFIPSNFKFNQVPTAPPGQAIAAAVPRVPAPSLGPLAPWPATPSNRGLRSRRRHSIFGDCRPTCVTTMTRVEHTEA